MPINYSLGKIYTIVNSVNNSVYVGSTAQKTLAVRMAHHRSLAKNPTDKTRSWPLYVAMREFGIEQFKMILHHTFACNSKDELESNEYQLMKDLIDDGITIYNTILAKKGHHQTDETKAKISLALNGRTFTDEAKAKMSIAKTGKTLSDETKAKLSISHTGSKNSVFVFGSLTYDSKANMWRFRWSPKAKCQQSKSFSCNKHGQWQAKLLAESVRRTAYPEWRSDEELTVTAFMNIIIE